MTVATWKPLEKKYKPRLMKMAEEVRSYLASEPGIKATEVYDFTDEDLAVEFVVSRRRKERVDVTLRLMDAEAWDGEENGTNFMLDVVAEGGRPVGQCVPYNYSYKVWVDPTDEAAVEERWLEFCQAWSAEDVADSINRFWDRKE